MHACIHTHIHLDTNSTTGTRTHICCRAGTRSHAAIDTRSHSPLICMYIYMYTYVYACACMYMWSHSHRHALAQSSYMYVLYRMHALNHAHARRARTQALDLRRVCGAVCFFVLCKRHWINRVPGAHQGKFPVYTLRDSLSQRKNIYSLTGKGQD